MRYTDNHRQNALTKSGKDYRIRCKNYVDAALENCGSAMTQLKDQETLTKKRSYQIIPNPEVSRLLAIQSCLRFLIRDINDLVEV
jgi:hypothetical protein